MKKTDPRWNDSRIIEGSGNVFVDLGFPPEEALVLAMRSQLIAKLRLLIEQNEWTQVRAARELGISQSRVSDLIRGKWDKFSLDMLLVFAARAGLHPTLRFQAAA